MNPRTQETRLDFPTALLWSVLMAPALSWSASPETTPGVAAQPSMSHSRTTAIPERAPPSAEVSGLNSSPDLVEHREGAEPPTLHRPERERPGSGLYPAEIRGTAGVMRPGGLPDLRVALQLPGGDAIYPLKVKVWNAGTSTAPASTLTIQWSETGIHGRHASASRDAYRPITVLADRTVRVPALNPHAEYVVPGLGGRTIHCRSRAAVHCRVKATADSDSRLLEANENNNEAEVTVRASHPSLDVSDRPARR